jgi:hypothetical protein
MLEVLGQKTQSIGAGIHVGIIDLVGVAGEDHFGALSRAGQNGFHFMGRQVLGLVHDEELLRNAATTNVGQRLNAQVTRFFELACGHGGASALLHVGCDDELKIVIDGLHVRAQLFVHVARQIAEISAHGHDRAAHQKLVVVLFIHDLLKASGDGQQGFASARLAKQGHHLDGIIEQ